MDLTILWIVTCFISSAFTGRVFFVFCWFFCFYIYMKMNASFSISTWLPHLFHQNSTVYSAMESDLQSSFAPYMMKSWITSSTKRWLQKTLVDYRYKKIDFWLTVVNSIFQNKQRDIFRFIPACHTMNICNNAFGSSPKLHLKKLELKFNLFYPLSPSAKRGIIVKFSFRWIRDRIKGS